MSVNQQEPSNWTPNLMPSTIFIQHLCVNFFCYLISIKPYLHYLFIVTNNRTNITTNSQNPSIFLIALHRLNRNRRNYLWYYNHNNPVLIKYARRNRSMYCEHFVVNWFVNFVRQCNITQATKKTRTMLAAGSRHSKGSRRWRRSNRSRKVPGISLSVSRKW